MTSNQINNKSEFVAELINERLAASDKILAGHLAANNISKAEMGLIREFLHYRVQFKKISANRAKVITHLLCGVRKHKMCPDLTRLETEDVATLFLALESDNSPYSQNTACTVDELFRTFSAYLVDNKGYTLDLKKIKDIKKPSADLDGIKPSDVLSEAKFDELIRHGHNARDKAILAIFADCGVRPEEIELLKWEDVEFTAENVRLNVTDAKNKKVKKMNYVIDRKEYLQVWKSMNEGDSPKMPVFRSFINARSIIQSNKAIDALSVGKMVRFALDSAKIPYPTNYACRLLRTSNITNQLKAGLDQVAIMKSHWAAGLNSKMWKHYERLAGIDTEAMFMKNSGRKVTDLRQKEVRESFICECGHVNPPGRTECIRCHSELKKPSSEAEKENEALKARLAEMEDKYNRIIAMLEKR